MLTTTRPIFARIESALAVCEHNDAAFHLEVALRQPDPACDELPSHDELLADCGLTCSVAEFLAWCDWQNRRQKVIDRDEMAGADSVPIAA